MPDKWLTTAQVAERLDLSLHQVYRRIHRGDLPAKQVQERNVQYRISEADLADYEKRMHDGALTPARVRPTDALRIPEVARLTGFTVETIRKLCKEGRIAHFRGAGARGHVRITRQALDDFRNNVTRTEL